MAAALVAEGPVAADLVAADLVAADPAAGGLVVVDQAVMGPGVNYVDGSALGRSQA